MHDVHLDWFAACCTSFAAQKQNALGGVAGARCTWECENGSMPLE